MFLTSEGLLPHNSNLGHQQGRSASSSPMAMASMARSTSAEIEAERKISDHKEQQTDITYGHVNKKVQADTMNSEDHNSDVDIDTDADATSSVLSQSIRLV